MQNLTPADRVSAARIRMLQRMPFYGLLAMRLQLKPDPSATDLWVDGATLGYNPTWVNTASFDELMTAIAHGASHIALLHHLRRNGRNNDHWQRACDIPVNAALQESEFTLPAGAVVNPGDELKSAEECYNGMDDQDNENGEGGGEGDQDQTGPGEVKDQPGKSGGAMDESEVQQAIADTLKDVAAAAQQAKSSGFGLPAGLARQIGEVLYPREDWRELLREYMHSIAKADYSWTRPNRRFIGSGLYLPALHAESEMGPLVVAVDTSGSIDSRKLALFVRALNELLEELNPETVYVIGCDSKIHTFTEYSRDDYPIEINFQGMGCTDLRPPFERCEEEGIIPDALLYFTDLEGPKPLADPGYPVIWLDQGEKSPDAHYYPCWGKCISLRG